MAKFNPNINKASKAISSWQDLLRDLRKGDRVALAKAITIIESEKNEDQQIAADLLNEINSLTSKTIRLGITGSPGVGKSTLIEILGQGFINNGKKPAILAIDPSSQTTGGSILGDKTRMEKLSKSTEAFIRPSPAGKTLGGVAKKTRESILLVEAAGFNPVIVETVGVGQSEISVKSMTDIFILLVSPGAGDEIQGIKRGVMELADIIVVNKMDGEWKDEALKTQQQYKNAVSLLKPVHENWKTPVIAVSALSGHGVDEMINIILKLKQFLILNQHLSVNRRKQEEEWFEQSLQEGFYARILKHPRIEKQYQTFKDQVLNEQSPPFKAANDLMDLIEKHLLK